MEKGKFNVVTDGAWGSCGKGLIATAIAARYRPEIISTTNMANAGHTAVKEDGSDEFIAKLLPSPAILNAWIPEYTPGITIGPTAAFHISQLQKEVDKCQCDQNLYIHPRAGVITEIHRQIETDLQDGTKHIASTMQGCGAFLSDKVMRRRELKLARDYPETAKYCDPIQFLKAMGDNDIANSFAGTSMPLFLMALMNRNDTILHEGSQGFSLCINHGSHYPQCTSRSTTAPQNAADMGIPPQYIGKVYLVIRPAPIRVGNVVENGQTVGYSGDCYEDHEETTWEQVATAAGAPPEVMKGELTTVTKRLRRVFTFSERQLIEAAAINGATDIVLNFANYIDWSCYGTNDYNQLPPKVRKFIEHIENLINIPVSIVGTGPRNDHVCFVDSI